MGPAPENFFTALFNVVIISQSVCHFHSSPMFQGKVRSLPLVWSGKRGTARLGFSLVHKC